MDTGLCIIGHDKSESNIRLLEEAKKRFDSVFFVPINSIGIGLTDKFSIAYRITDLLKFPAVLARVPQSSCSYAYQLLSLFPQETFMPIKPISFLLAAERFFLLTVLRKRGVDTINLRLTKSKNAAERLLDVKFPCIVRTPEKKTGVIVENKSEAKSIIDALTSLDKSILIEDTINEMVSVYVASQDVIASVKKKTKEKDIVFSSGELKKTKISLDVERIAVEAASAVDAQIARIDIALADEPVVVNIDLNPDLITPSSVSGVNLPETIAASLHDSFESHLKKPLLVKFFEDAGSVVKDVLKAKHLL